MTGIADELAAAGKPMEEEELISFVMAGLGPDYNGLVGTIGLLNKDTPISLDDLYSQVLAQDQRDEMQGAPPTGGFESSGMLP